PTRRKETVMNQPSGLPRFVQDYTEQQRADVVAWLAGMPLDELRTRQDVNRRMVRHAQNSPYTMPAGQLESLRLRGEILADAVEIVLLANMANAGLSVRP